MSEKKKRDKSELAIARDAYTAQICQDKCKCKKRSKRAGTGGTMAQVAKELGRRWQALNPEGKKGGSDAQNAFITDKYKAWKNADTEEGKSKYLVRITSGKKKGTKRPPLGKFMEFSSRYRAEVKKKIDSPPDEAEDSAAKKPAARKKKPPAKKKAKKKAPADSTQPRRSPRLNK